jgi:diguanylate cyclase (GGDEF)-like protein
MLQTSGIDEQDIDRALQRPWWRLKLPPALLARFEAETGPARCRHLTVYALLALVLYDLYLITDIGLVPDIFAEAAVMRLAFTTPLCLAMILALRLGPPPWLRESMQVFIAIVAAGTILWLMKASQSPISVYQHYGIVLVILFANVVQRIRFWYATAASLIILAAYVAVVLPEPAFPLDARISAIAILASAVWFTLMAAHTLERETQRGFLLTLRDRIHRHELEVLSRQDPLTGLGNRRHIDGALHTAWKRAAANRSSLALMMIDIDAFKAFNDRYGHLVGDTALKRVSAIVSAELRDANDVAARFGGEELLLLMDSMELGAVIRIGDRIRRAVEELAIPHQHSPFGVVTVSVGAAAVVPSDAIESHEFVAAADSALYAAKHAGRNQVWPPLPPSADIVSLAGEAATARAG